MAADFTGSPPALVWLKEGGGGMKQKGKEKTRSMQLRVSKRAAYPKTINEGLFFWEEK